MKRNSITHTALLAMLAIAIFVGCNQSDTKEDQQLQQQPIVLEQSNVEQPIVADTTDLSTENIVFADIPGDVKIDIRRGKSMLLEMNGVSLSAPDSAIIREGTYTVTALRKTELPPLSDEMVNVTFGSGNGYRFLPNGEHFKPYAELRMAYDESKLPLGYTPDDIYTSYYDEEKKTWVRLFRKEVDTVNKEIVSLTTHFTDFINEILKAPEMPETEAFVPTMISDLEAANPLEGISLIQPPTANNMGTANLNYPLQIPAGRGGMQPNLALTYNSGGGNGWLGIGWDISIPCISVETRWGVPRYSTTEESESYLLNGEQLVMKDDKGNVYLPHRNSAFISRTDTNEQRFYARIDEAHDSIVRHGTSPKDYWWSVTDRNGVTHYYGKKKGSNSLDTESVLRGIDGSIAKWMLTESIDPNGNTVRYYYEVTRPQNPHPLGKTIYPSSIEYTGHYDGNTYTDGKYEIRFNRQGIVRDDIITSCNYGFEEVIDAILCNVTVAYEDKPFRLYHFYMHNNGNTLHKTMLNKVSMIDSLSCGTDVLSIIANDYCTTTTFQNPNIICTTLVGSNSMGNYLADKIIYGEVSHTFDYKTSPDKIFSETVTTISGLNDVGLSMPEKLKGATGYGITELGFTTGDGWNAGGGLNVGLGFLVGLTSSSAGLSYNYGNSTSEGQLTLIDIDGDGYQDKVYTSGNGIYYCKRINGSNGNFSYAKKQLVKELSNVGSFMKEKSHSHTLSEQLNFVASINLSETWTNSYTENYFSDVNADGLPDLVTPKGVYFNDTDTAGNVSFLMQQNTGDDNDSVDIITTNLMNCGSMIYDGELNDSIYYKPTIDQTITLDVSTTQLDSLIGVMINCGWIVDSIIPFQNYYSVTLHNLKLNKDSIRSNRERMVSMENSEAVKIWVAPMDGTITINSTIGMFDSTGGLEQSRYADGVKYTVQHDKINYAAIDSSTTTLPCTTSVAIPELTGILTKDSTDTISKNSTLSVNEGDIIYFRLQSQNTHYYDHVLWNQEITYNNISSNLDTYGKFKNTYKSTEDFIVSSDKYFKAVSDGNLVLDIEVDIGQLNQDAKLIVYRNASNVFEKTLYSNSGHAIYKTNFLVNNGDSVIIKITDMSLTNNTTFGNIICKPHYTFIPLNNSSIIKDTVEYDIPAYYNVKTNIKPIYNKLFGPLYRGWGQFTYNSDDHDSPINISGYRCLIESDVAIDSTEIASPDNIDTLATSFDNLNAVLDNAGLESVSSNSPFYAMEPSSKHWLWYGPANATLVTSNGMSNTIRTDIFGTMGEDKIVRDCPAPAPTTEYPSVKVHSKTSKSFNFNINYSVGFDIYGNMGSSANKGHSKIISDFMDMNGDRYPDLIGEGAIQYTKPSGGLGTKICEYTAITSDETYSNGREKGGSFIAAAYLNNRKGQVANCSGATGSALDNMSGNYSEGAGESEEILIDVNGDGLPDKIDKDGNVYLNWGYKFISTHGSWLGGFNRESSFETGGLNYNGNDLFNICQFSIGGGFGINYSHNQTNAMLIDLNGDGLPDKVYKDDNNRILVKYNKGNGEWATKIIMGISDIVRSYSLSGSTNISGTIGFTLWGLKMTGTLSGSAFNPSCNIDKVQIADFNNDGLPDFVTSDGIGTIKVRYNQLGGVNLLKKVTNPMGGTIEIGYSLTESSIKNPNRTWVMNSVTIDAQSSPVGGSIMKTSYEYSNPYYDRYERTSYGFEKVTTRQHKSNNTVYRYTEECYNNTTYALKGKKKSEALFDGSGKKYTETIYDMAIKDPETNNSTDSCTTWTAPAITAQINNYYEGQTTVQLTTMISYEYDNYRNITKFRNWGNTADSTDDAIVNITYYTNRPKNMVGLKSGFTVRKAGSGSTPMRKYDFNYDTSGNLIEERIYKGSTISNSNDAVYNMTYDGYGNVLTFRKPADENNYRQEYDYTYDTSTHTYPTSITDAFNLTSTATYDYRFGVPLQKTDPSGNRVIYTYDYRGRTKTITGPKELAANKPYTIRMEYYPIGELPGRVFYANWTTPIAQTFHYDTEHPNDPIQTTVLCDKIGRVIQTKKDGMVNGVDKTIVSGKIELDEFGRTVKQYLPFSENVGQTGKYDTSAVGVPTTMEYDVMDRQTKITYPDSAVLTNVYSVANDYSGTRKFLTKTTDPLNRITYTYTDYAGKTTQITDALNGNTKMEYDCLHQLKKTTDPEGYTTTYSYDNLGRMTSRVHPDEGTTTFTYNPAGQVTRKTNADNDYITYKYNRNRLTQIQYSKHPQNNVTYTYDTIGNGKGRITKVENGSMIKLIEYGNMGEVVAETKTFAIPNTGNVYTFRMHFEYDSWNRMQKITYPDGEIVQYTYDQGGNLLSMSGTKNNATTNYITKIRYNEQEKRSYIEYGNGVKTRYKYDSRMRLDSLICTDNSNNVLQKIKYTYDNVDNITRVVNSGSTVNTLGGNYVYTHSYDPLNRLTNSSGTYRGSNSYSLGANYSSAGRITKKVNSKLSQTLIYTYCSNDKPHAPRRILNSNDGYITDLRWDKTGNLGQINYYDKEGVWQQTRHIGWTEDNRITNVIDKSYHSYYSYDDGGERVLKLTGPSNIIDVNAEFLTYQSDLKNITLYTSPYLVAHNKGYTKHFYAGSERVCAAIGEGGLNSQTTCIGQNSTLQNKATNLFNNTMGSMHDRNLLDNTECLNNGKDVDLEEVVTRVVINSSIDGSTFRSTLNKYCSQNNANSATYYYHSDHLGSASWITNKTGAPVQHLQYMPYGEPLVNERTGSYEERYTFTGKERDSETGYSYFGARFYDSDLMTGWLSVDPQSDKFPNISPYNYCNWNPVKLVDPDGNSPLSIGAKFLANRATKAAVKTMVKEVVSTKLKRYASQNWAKELLSDALTGVDMAMGQSWWEYAIEFVPFAGDAYGVYKASSQAIKVAEHLNNVEKRIENIAKAINGRGSLRRNIGLTDPNREAHHLIPIQALKKSKVVQAAVEAGFDFNGEINGVAVSKGHGPHLDYNEKIINDLDAWGKKHKGYTPDEAKAHVEKYVKALKSQYK